MKKNMGILDRVIRIIIATILGIICYKGIISGTLEMVMLGITLIFALTSFTSFCPLYAAFRLLSYAGKE